MSTSTITLPVLVEDKGAIAELKKIQAQLGAVGLSSASLNKTIATSMDRRRAWHAPG